MYKKEQKTESFFSGEDGKAEELARFVKSLGLEGLARDILEERLARRILEQQINHNYFSVQSEIWRDRSEKALENAVTLQAALFDKAATYNNVVATLGYAGFFSVWSLVSDQLSQTENAAIGFFLGVSLLIFVCWTISVAIMLTFNTRRYAIIAGTQFETFDDELAAHKEAEDKVKRSMLRFQRFWPWSFITSTFTGLVAGLYVLLKLFLQIIGINRDFISLVTEALQ